MEKFENEDIETYCGDTIPTPTRPKRAKRTCYNYKQLNEGKSSSPSPMVMAMNYEESFLINATPNIAPDEDQDEVEVQDPMKHVKLKCLICYKSFKLHKAFSTRNHFSANYCSKVFSTLCRLLLSRDDHQGFNWDFEFDEFPLPFCTECSKDVIGLLKLHQLIEGYQQSILEVVYDIKAQIHETEAELPNLELLDDDNNEILNRYKEKIKVLRKSAINDFHPSSDSTKYKVFTERRITTTRRRPKQERMDDRESNAEVVYESDDFVGSHDHDQEALVPKNSTEVKKSNLNPRVALERIKPNLSKNPQLSKRPSALRAKEVLSAAIKPDNEDDVSEEDNETEQNANMSPDPEWSENDDVDDNEDELPLEDSESRGSGSSIEDDDEENEGGTIEPISDEDNEGQAEPNSNDKNTNKLPNNTKKNLKRTSTAAAPKKSHKKKSDPTKVIKKKSPFMQTKDGKLLIGNIEIQKVKVPRKRIPQLPLITTKDGRLLFGDIEIQKGKTGNESKYKCSLCGSYNKDLSGIKRHIKDVHINRNNTTSKEAKCNICGKVLQNVGSMSRHHKIFHSSEPRKLHQCDLCGKTFTNYSSVNSHKILVHQVPLEAIDRPFLECDICGRPLFNHKLLKLHRLTHMNDDEKYLEILRLKEDDPTFILHQCSYCGKSEASAASLKTHEMIHTKQKPFQCHLCPKAFALKSNLQSHLETHKDINERELNFACDFPGCFKKFSTNKQLVYHSYVHRPLEERPFKCTSCAASFVHAHSLSKHTRQHAGVTYMCEHCGKTFTRPQHVTRHYKNIHQIQSKYEMPTPKLVTAEVERNYLLLMNDR